MLHFIYNDGLPEIEKSDDVFVMAQHLLVVADRHKLERLKLICQYVWTNSLTQAKVAIVCHWDCIGFPGLKRHAHSFWGVLAYWRKSFKIDDFKHLISSYPSLLKEVLAKVTSYLALKEQNLRVIHPCFLFFFWNSSILVSVCMLLTCLVQCNQ